MLLYQKLPAYVKAFLFEDGEIMAILGQGRHFFNPFADLRLEPADERVAQVRHPELEQIVKSGLLADHAEVADLKDNERGLLWIDGRFSKVLLPGVYAFWTKCYKVRIDVVDASDPRFNHPELMTIVKATGSSDAIDSFEVEDGQACVYFRNGLFVDVLKPGFYAFWKNSAKLKFYRKDLRERTLDISGQDIMTADKVTLRLNAVLAFQVIDPLKAVQCADDTEKSLYREAQLALRASVGVRDLDALLSDKDALTEELEATMRKKAQAFGMAIVSLGIRDVILPGDMKSLLNRVTEAKKEAEANLIVRREETAAVRSQQNTAKMLENNPVLMRLRELEVLERVAANSKLNVVLGEKGLTDRILNLV